MGAIKARTSVGEDDLGLLGRLPAGCVDLVYLDPPFFSNRAQGASPPDAAPPPREADPWQGGTRSYLEWIAAPLEDMHRILKPTGALFLVCEESVGLYVKLLLDEIGGEPQTPSKMVWWRADTRPAHHCVFYYRKSTEAGRHGHLYTVIHRTGEGNRSLLAFSFLQGQLARRASNHPVA
ncbi:MAG: DNA methyltransferase [Solirubrobacterales bacterium]